MDHAYQLVWRKRLFVTARVPAAPAPQAQAQEDESLNELKRRIEEMQAQIAKLASKS